MVEQRHGRIVNMASQAGLVGIPRHAAYSASKGAVIALTKVLALEWAPFGVTVNSVAPTFIRTPGTAERLDRPEFLADVLERLPVGRVGTTTDVAGAVIYLASPAASLVTGPCWSSTAAGRRASASGARRGDVVADEDRPVPVRLEPMGATAPALPIEMELLGGLLTAEGVVQRDPLGRHRLEAMRSAGRPREAGPSARAGRLRVGLQVDVRAHQSPMRVEPHPRGAAPLRDVGGGAFGDDELHDRMMARRGGAAVPAAPPACVTLSTGAIPERSSSSGGCTGSNGFFFWTAK